MASTDHQGTRRVTSHDVAALAGVSQATVARAFNNPDLLAPETMQRVRDAAASVAYVPNALARTLKSQRSHIVGAVVPAEGEYYQQALTELTRQLSDTGQQLLLFTFATSADIDDVLAKVLGYQLDAVVLASSSFAVDQIERMSATGVRVVAFNQPAAGGVVPSVSVDNVAGTGELASLLAEAGHRRVTFVGGVAEIETDKLRYRGAAEVLDGAGASCHYIEAGAYSYAAGMRAADRLLAESAPDAVMVASDEIAFGVIDGLRRSGVRVPHDVSVTGFDGLPQAAWASYDLTTIEQPVRELVEATVSLTTSRTPNEQILVPGRLRAGTTVSMKNQQGAKAP